MTRLAILALSLLALVLAPASAAAKEIYVSKDTGSDENEGTKEKPKKLLWKALGAYEAGDVIRVAEGMYHGQQKSGVMPQITKSVVLEGGWKQDFSERNPFKHLTIITAGFDRGGATSEVFRCEDRKLNVTIDGFLIDRGGGTVYYSDGEMGAQQAHRGPRRLLALRLPQLHRKMSGSDPSIELIGRHHDVRTTTSSSTPRGGASTSRAAATAPSPSRTTSSSASRPRHRGHRRRRLGQADLIIRNNTVAFGYEMEAAASPSTRAPDTGKYIVRKKSSSPSPTKPA
jgi:hypothetical protein